MGIAERNGESARGGVAAERGKRRGCREGFVKRNPYEDGEEALEPRKEWRVVQRPLGHLGEVPLGDGQRRGYR